jgi:hypothetical protein
MRSVRLSAVAFGATGVFLLAMAGKAQEKLGLAGPGESLRLALLRSPEVQKALELKAEQSQKIARIRERAKTAKKQVEAAHGKDKEKGKTKAEDQVAKEQERLAREAMNVDLAEAERETDRQINAVLDARQRTRLTQIVLRAEGPSAFLTPDLVDALGLVPDQLEQIRAILDDTKGEQEQFKESRKRSSELLKVGGDFELEKIQKDQAKAQERAHAYRVSRQVMTEIGRVLTRGQRERYNRMIGEAFELARLSGPKGQSLFDESADVAGSLLRQPSVQLELKLTAQQKERLGRGEAAAKVLDSAQQARLRQIVLQGEGLAALIRPDVARALRLDDEQIEQIQGVFDELLGAHRQLRDMLKAAPRDPEFDRNDPEQEEKRKEQEKTRLRSGATDLRDGATQQINTILTRRQRDAFARLLGRKFDFTKVRTPPPDR